jgi:ABC-type sugar transport system substrate-binding protein
MTGPTRRGGRHEVGLVSALVLLGALFLVVALAAVAEHVALLAAVALPVAAAFWLGRRYQRGRGLPAAVQRRAPGETDTGPLAAVPSPADQIAQLEQLAARPIEAIIASYQHVARYHHGGQQ